MATYLGTRKLKDGRVVHRAIVRRKGWPRRVFQAETKTATRPSDGSEPVKGCMDLAADYEAEIRAGKTNFQTRDVNVNLAVEVYLGSEEYQDLKKRHRQRRRLEWICRLAVPWGGTVGDVELRETETVHRACGVVKAALAAGEGPRPFGHKRVRPASRATQNRYLSALAVALDTAARSDPSFAMPYNPAKTLRIRSENNRTRTWFRDPEILALYEACKRSGDERLPVLLLCALSSAARRSELLQIGRQELNLKEGAVAVSGKRGYRRRIRFYGWALEELRRFVRETPPAISGYVFGNRWGQPVFPRKPWEEALKAAGLKPGPASERGKVDFHCTRHTSLTLAATRGATEADLAAHGGHRSLKGLDTYLHLAEEEGVESELAERLLPDWRGARLAETRAG